MFIMIGGFVMADACFVGICLYIVAMYEELKYMLNAADDDEAGANRRQIQLNKCVQFHGDILQWAIRILIFLYF